MSLKTQVSHDLEKSSSSSSISSPSEKRPTPIVKIQHCQEINCYRKINTFSIGEIIGMGTYGVVSYFFPIKNGINFEPLLW